MERCSKVDISMGICYGGYARLMTLVEMTRQQEPNVLLFDAGDQFQGSTWFTMFKEQPIVDAMNAVRYDAMVLGNHEFDEGLEVLESFVSKVTFPVLGTNVHTDCERLNDLLVDSLEFNIENLKIGVLGVLTKETEGLSFHGSSIEIENTVDSLRRWVARLQSKGCKFIILLSHSGLTPDINLCKSVPGIDVIIGGHSHSFTYTGPPPHHEVPVAQYPEVVWNNNRPCLVVTSYERAKYLGYLQVVVDELSGRLLTWNGQPILLDTSIEEDKRMLDKLEKYRLAVLQEEERVVGRTVVVLDSTNNLCRLGECNVGNWIADSLVDQLVYKDEAGTKEHHWTRSAVAIFNGGSIRKFRKTAPGIIYNADLRRLKPFYNTICVISLSGETLLAIFEQSVENYSPKEPSGRFLQVSGVQVVYNMSKPNGQRVKSLKLRCHDCPTPMYIEVNKTQVYPIATSNYISGGGDGYYELTKGLLGEINTGISLNSAMKDYLTKYNPITIGLENRIVITD